MDSETFSFVLTGEDGSRWFGYCKKLLVSNSLTFMLMWKVQLWWWIVAWWQLCELNGFWMLLKRRIIKKQLQTIPQPGSSKAEKDMLESEVRETHGRMRCKILAVWLLCKRLNVNYCCVHNNDLLSLPFSQKEKESGYPRSTAWWAASAALTFSRRWVNWFPVHSKLCLKCLFWCRLLG